MKRRNIVTSAALTVICLVLVIPIVVYSFPFMVGADSSYTVMSGSMSPALSPGDLVIVKGEDPIYIGDIVTVEPGESTYTHRVIEKLEGDRFVLKGDANEDPDASFVEASQIIGKVVMVFPFSHLYTPYGFGLALLAPAGLIIGNQLYIVYQHTKRKNKKETMLWRRKNRNLVISTSTLLLALILTVSTTRLIAPQFIAGSRSYFSDTESGSDNIFSAGVWVFSSTITCLAEPPTINSGESVTISGIIDPPHSAEVTIEFSLNKGPWTLLAKVTSDSVGSYVYVWGNIGVGSYEIRAIWNGDDDHYGATSGTVTVVVS